MSRVRHGWNGDVGGACTRSTVVIGAGYFPLHFLQGRGRRPPLGERRVRAWACFLRRYEPDQVPRVCGLATLSARRRSPEAVFSCRGWYRRHVADPVAHPGDDVVDLGWPHRLVMQLVPRLRVDAPRHTVAALEGGTRVGGDQPVELPVDDERGQ